MNKKIVALLELVSLFFFSLWLLQNQATTGGFGVKWVYVALWVAVAVLIRSSARFLDIEAFKSNMPEYGLTKIKEGWKYFLPSLFVSGLFIIAGFYNRTLDDSPPIPPIYYFLLVIFQQLAIIYSVRKMAVVFGLKSALLISPFLFGGFHWPNLYLALLTFIGGFWFSWLYYRYRNFYLLCASHFVLGLALSCSFYWDLGKMLVGNAYVHHEKNILHLRRFR